MKPYRKLFIVGCERSGTTWVRSLLGEHPLVVTERESHLASSCYVVADDPARPWRTLVEQFEQSVADGRAAGLQRWVDREVLDRLVAVAEAAPDRQHAAALVIGGAFDRLFSAAGGTADHVLVEKTPADVFWADRLLRAFPEAKVVEVVRDGRDVCVSMGHRHRWSEFLGTREAQMGRWVAAIGAGARARERPEAHGRWHVVHYEALHARPVEQTAALYAFASLPGGVEVAGAAVERHRFERIDPRHVSPDRHFRGGRVGDWRSELRDDEIELLERVGGSTLVAAGYSLSHRGVDDG